MEEPTRTDHLPIIEHTASMEALEETEVMEPVLAYVARNTVKPKETIIDMAARRVPLVAEAPPVAAPAPLARHRTDWREDSGLQPTPQEGDPADEAMYAEQRTATFQGDYSDVDTTVLKAIKTAEMYASLRINNEGISSAASARLIEQVQAIRLALRGIGQVGQHFNAVGQPVGDQIAIVLTSHEAEALIMALTGRVRFETIARE